MSYKVYNSNFTPDFINGYLKRKPADRILYENVFNSINNINIKD